MVTCIKNPKHCLVIQVGKYATIYFLQTCLMRDSINVIYKSHSEKCDQILILEEGTFSLNKFQSCKETKLKETRKETMIFIRIFEMRNLLFRHVNFAC